MTKDAEILHDDTMHARHKPVKKVSKKAETRNRLILYISAVSIGLPLLFANIYFQNQNTDVLGANTKVTTTRVQGQIGNNGNSGDVQNKLTCDMCVKAVHGDGVIVLQKVSQNSKEWGAICLPKAALSSAVNSSLQPIPSIHPTKKTLTSSETSFKNMPYILCPQLTDPQNNKQAGSPKSAPKSGTHNTSQPADTSNH